MVKNEAIATRRPVRGWFDEAIAALGVWVVFTAAIVVIAPVIARVGVLPAAAVVVPGCLGLGWLLGRTFARWRPRPAAGVRLGVAVLVVGQLLDTALVALAGEYPRAGVEGSVTILALLLTGYPVTLLGSALADGMPWRGPA